MLTDQESTDTTSESNESADAGSEASDQQTQTAEQTNDATGNETQQPSDSTEAKESADQGSDEKDSDEKVTEYGEFEVPEGAIVNEPAMAKFKELALSKNLSQEDAQAFVNLGAEMVDGMLTDLKAQIAGQAATWADQVKSDSELGGDNMKENLAEAMKSFEAFGKLGPKDQYEDFRQQIEMNGLANHPFLIRVFKSVAGNVTQDGHIVGLNQPVNEKEDRTTTLYG